ncbi:hypothetical protein DFH08DRAFT_975715 [Mycena albidolilacea]|uniref:Uncharacterized protein n=1 Tax=Mycena albidolilacea TaxID=1033008 RepID=A0AAD7EB25_9AGAR|nr:hypothetical protein DFH08DRAFT_975715 [Mycena albidolilacea]
MRVINDGCKFIPTRGLDHTDLDGDSQQRSQGEQLFDLFLPAEADTCPHATVRNRPDGHITGDLFEEVKPGSIEDHVLTSCADLVRNCVIVGHYKPGIVLFVEPVTAKDSPEDEGRFKTAILNRISAFNARLILHERIESALQIVSVPLPRTREKGNIRRKDEHSVALKEIYASFQI